MAQWEVASPHPLDPKPISPATFWAVYGKAVEAGDSTFAALLLAALNCCAYGGEVSRMLWDEIDDQGGYVSRRPKTGVSRVAVLWPETLLAIRALPRNRDTIFNTRVRSFTVHSVADAFERYRDLASQDKTLTFGTIRDAAYTRQLLGFPMPRRSYWPATGCLAPPIITSAATRGSSPRPARQSRRHSASQSR